MHGHFWWRYRWLCCCRTSAATSGNERLLPLYGLFAFSCWLVPRLHSTGTIAALTLGLAHRMSLSARSAGAAVARGWVTVGLLRIAVDVDDHARLLGLGALCGCLVIGL